MHMKRRSVVIGGSTYENVLNLGRGYIEKIERKYGGTRQGEEELFARMFNDAEGATAKAEWIERARRQRPDRFMRRIIGIDPAVTKRGSSDQSGIILAGLGVDEQAYAIADHTGKWSPDEWGKIVLDLYEREQCDLIVVETNKAGDFPTQNIRACARERGWSIVLLGKEERPKQFMPRVVYVREVYSKGEKADRAKPLSTAYERGQVSHIAGAKLEDLEETLTTWVPTPGSRSPDRLDALVHAILELLGLKMNKPDARGGFVGITEAARQVTAPASVSPSISHAISSVLGGGQRGGRI